LSTFRDNHKNPRYAELIQPVYLEQSDLEVVTAGELDFGWALRAWHVGEASTMFGHHL
jgi:hypothetical protein